MPAVFFIQIFCFSFSFYSFATSIYNALKVLGLRDIYLKISILSKIIGIATLLLAVIFNVYAIAISSFITIMFTLIIFSFFFIIYLKYNAFELMTDLFPNIIICMIMSLIVYFIGKLNLNIVVLLFNLR